MTPAHATTEPTDKSKSPAARQNNIVHATMPVIETARASPRMLAQDRKFSTPTEQPMNNNANTSSMPASSKNFPNAVGWRAVGVVVSGAAISDRPSQDAFAVSSGKAS